MSLNTTPFRSQDYTNGRFWFPLNAPVGLRDMLTTVRYSSGMVGWGATLGPTQFPNALPFNCFCDTDGKPLSWGVESTSGNTYCTQDKMFLKHRKMRFNFYCTNFNGYIRITFFKIRSNYPDTGFINTMWPQNPTVPIDTAWFKIYYQKTKHLSSTLTSHYLTTVTPTPSAQPVSDINRINDVTSRIKLYQFNVRFKYNRLLNNRRGTTNPLGASDWIQGIDPDDAMYCMVEVFDLNAFAEVNDYTQINKSDSFPNTFPAVNFSLFDEVKFYDLNG